MNILAIVVLALLSLAQLACGIPISKSSADYPNQAPQLGALVSYLMAGHKGDGSSAVVPPWNGSEYASYFEQLWNALKRPDGGNRHGHGGQNKPNRPGKPSKPTPTSESSVDMPTIVAPKVPTDGYSIYTDTPLFTTYDASELLTKVFP